ncbi:MAG: DNA repair protein RadC [Oscillospiraceae bacterium]|nr:DNA repair protein RadC [Oscillospiraceae bacterium]
MDNPHEGHRERLRAQFRKSGLDSFNDHTALELLLCYAIPRADVNVLAHRLIDTFGDLAGVLGASQEELCKVKGVGERTAALIALAPAIVRKSAISRNLDESDRILNSSEKAGEFIKPYFMGARDEIVYELTLDNKCRLINVRKLAEGEPNCADLSTRHLVENALRDNASCVILAHNHPSGVAIPSHSDLRSTEQASAALKTVGVRLLDHIIVAEEDYVSLARSSVPCLNDQ